MTNRLTHIYTYSGTAYSPKGQGDLAYVGETTQLGVRLGAHTTKLSHGSHENPHMQDYVDEFGLQFIEVRVQMAVPFNLRKDVERLLIHRWNTNHDANAFGWNRSVGGEGPRELPRPIALWKNGQLYEWPSVYDFLVHRPELDVVPVIALIESKIDEWQGWRKEIRSGTGSIGSSRAD
jgi:hypothetical protein